MSRLSRLHPWFGIIALHVGAAGAGYALSRTPMPMPWLIGPMTFSTLFGIFVGKITLPRLTRPLGQLVVAGVVGLTFTSSALVAVATHFTAMIFVAIATIFTSLCAALVLKACARIDFVTACIASVPAGAIEMAALAEKYGADAGPVAFVQTLRLSLLVLIIPALLAALSGGVPESAAILGSSESDYSGGMLLLAIGLAGGVVFSIFRLNSPFFLGSLAFTAAAATFSLPIAMPPFWLLCSAQILLGIWLGSMFDRTMFTTMGSFVVSAIVSTTVLVILAIILALVVASMSGIDWRTMILATAPGSVIEMALTARLLEIDPAMVTAFHIVRIFMLLVLAPLVVRLSFKISIKKDAPPR